MKRNLLQKYFLSVAIFILLSVLALGGALSWQAYSYSIEEKRTLLTEKAEQVADATTNLLSNYSSLRRNSYNMFISAMTEGGRQHILITSPDGQIAVSSDDTEYAFKGRIISENILESLAKNGSYTGMGTLGGVYNTPGYTVAVSIENTLGQCQGYVFVTAPMSSMRKLLYDIIKMFIFAAILVFIFACVFSYIAARSMSRPIRDMSRAAKKFAQGDFSTRLKVNRLDEIGELMYSFNDMAESLERSDERKRDFLANVSHELRSPMTSISGFVDGMLDGTIPEDRREHYLGIVSDEVHRLSRLVKRMLDITRLQTKDVSSTSVEFDICDTIRRVVLGFEQKLTTKKLKMSVNVCEYQVNIFANEDMIYQAIYNLVENAIKFAEEESVITITLKERAGNIFFSITNKGNTIEQSEIKSIFERFHKSDRSRSNDKEGLGLGLYIVKTIINQHKGDVNVKSADGETEFSFVIPSQLSK